MPHLWVQNKLSASSGASRAQEWALLPLESAAFALMPGVFEPVLRDDASPCRAAALLLRSESEGRTTWLVMNAGESAVRINGTPLCTGIRALADRDELCVEGVGRFFLSTERLACIEAFPGASDPVVCARCRRPIEPGTAAVECPSCGVWHHQHAELPCWTHVGTCAAHCGQRTPLDAGFRWTPEDL